MALSEALWWLPTAIVAAVATAGVLAAKRLPEPNERKRWVGVLLGVGAAGIAISAWQQHGSRTALGSETERLRELGNRLDAVGKLLPAGPGKTPG